MILVVYEFAPFVYHNYFIKKLFTDTINVDILNKGVCMMLTVKKDIIASKIISQKKLFNSLLG